jgi:hypothetical protein
MIQRACVLAGILGLFLQGSAGGHMLLVEHARCAVHGDLVHDSDPRRHGLARHASADVASAQASQDTGSDEAHDHCTPSSDRRDATVVIGTSLQGAHLRDAGQTLVVAHALIVPRAVRLRIAPKNSP